MRVCPSRSRAPLCSCKRSRTVARKELGARWRHKTVARPISTVKHHFIDYEPSEAASGPASPPTYSWGGGQPRDPWHARIMRTGLETGLTTMEVRAEHLGKTFDSDGRRTEALAGLDFGIEAGEFVSLIGPSGCGKSTLLRLIGGLLEPDTGQITGRWRSAPGWSPLEAVRPRAAIAGAAALAIGATEPDLATPTQPRAWPIAQQQTTSPSSLILSASRRSPTPFRQSCRGECNSASAWPEPSRCARRSCSWTSPSPPSTKSPAQQMRFLLLDLWVDTSATVVFVTHSIEEAVLLSDRVMVLTNRPGRIAADLKIDLPRPRRHGIEDDDDFHRHTATLRAALNTATACRGLMTVTP